MTASASSCCVDRTELLSGVPVCHPCVPRVGPQEMSSCWSDPGRCRRKAIHPLSAGLYAARVPHGVCCGPSLDWALRTRRTIPFPRAGPQAAKLAPRRPHAQQGGPCHRRLFQSDCWKGQSLWNKLSCNCFPAIVRAGKVNHGKTRKLQ